MNMKVSVNMNMNVAGTAASDGVSDWAGGLAGDSAGDLAGHGSDTGIGDRRGLIRSGVGQDTITMPTQRGMGPTIPTTAIIRLPLPLGPKIIRAVMLSRHRLTKVTRHPRLAMQGSRCRRFCT